jgi:GNAT superfamily N-acetyltransferase
VRVRRATRDDLPAEYEVFRSAIGELFRRHSFDPPDPPYEAFAAYHAHLLDHDGERCVVAEQGRRVLGYAAAFGRGDAWFLASLFVRPDVQSRGVGRALLQAVWGDFARRLTMTDSIQPVSNGLYASRGLVPAAPVFTLAGRVVDRARPGLEPAAPEAGALARLDAATYRFDRALDHGYWGRHATPTLWLREGEPVAYSYAWKQGRVGPVAGLDGAAAADALRGELARGPGTGFALVPGTCRELFAAALGAGLRILGPPGLLLTSDGVEPPRSLALSGFSLF